MKKINVIGLGKLGSCTAAVFATKFDVLGMDLNTETVDLINNKIAPVVEPSLEILIKCSQNLRATNSCKEVMEHGDISFIIVPTPSDAYGNFTDIYVEKAINGLMQYKDKNRHHHFVIVSTVMPGTTQQIKEKHSWRDDNFSISYNPEFIALGSVIEDFTNPDIVLIGSDKEENFNELENIYLQVVENKPHFAKMKPIEAEITKISLNTFITLKISFANMLSNLSEKATGVNIDNITTALGADKRVSPYYLKGGTAFGGPCFPRDGRAFNNVLRSYKIQNEIPLAIEKTNELQTENLFKKIKACGGVIGIVGLSYKKGTPVTEESASLKLIDKFIFHSIDFRDIIVYDELAIEQVKAIYGEKISYASSALDCIALSDVIVFAIDDKELIKVLLPYIKESLIKGKRVIDCWRNIDIKPHPLNLIQLGVNHG